VEKDKQAGGDIVPRPAPRPSVEIAASLTSGDLTRLADTAVLAEAAGADRIHLDVEDGVFIPTFTVGPGAVAVLRRVTRLPLEVHLQTIEPERWIEEAARGGADLIIVHVEGTRYPMRAVRLIRDAGVRAGIAVLLATPVELVLPLADEVRQVTVMSADPTPAGAYHPIALEKVRSLRGRVEAIELDGGVTVETLPAAVQAGVTAVVAGRGMFARGTDEVRPSIAALRAAGAGS
jgi:ribulose-phosphate 3-epimerase